MVDPSSSYKKCMGTGENGCGITKSQTYWTGRLVKKMTTPVVLSTLNCTFT